MRNSRCVALALHGYQVVRAIDGAAALDGLLRARPDVAVLDIGLPVMDGCGLAGGCARSSKARSSSLR